MSEHKLNTIKNEMQNLIDDNLKDMQTALAEFLDEVYTDIESLRTLQHLRSLRNRYLHILDLLEDEDAQ